MICEYYVHAWRDATIDIGMHERSNFSLST